MFVKNLSNQELQFKKNGAVLKLKPGINCVDVLKWDINDLKKTYGPTTLVFIGEEKQEAEVEVKDETIVVDGGEVLVNPEPESPVEVKEGDAGEADLANETPAPVVEDKNDGEAVKTETEVKAPAKATTKAKTGKKSNKQ